MSDDESSDFLGELREQYQASIPEKLKQFDRIVQLIHSTPTQSSLNELFEFIHKIAGSAGSYGFEEVSVLCKEFEVKVQEEKSHGDNLNDAFVTEIDAFAEKFAQAFTKQKEPAVHDEPSIEHIDIFVIDDDEDLLKLLVAMGKKKGMTVVGESHPSKAKERFYEENFSPKIVLFDYQFENEETNGLELVKAYRDSPGKSILGMLSAHGEMDFRLSAQSLGVELFFTKPLDLEPFFEELRRAMSTPTVAKLHMLLIDDDEDFCKFVKFALADLGLGYAESHDGENFFKRLVEVKPDLLLLDIDLPKFNGIELLKAARADSRFRSLPVMLITGKEQPQTQEEAFALGIEDFIIKPITKDLLRLRVSNFLKKRAFSSGFQEKDPVTNLFARNSMLDIFRVMQVQNKRIAVCLMEVSGENIDEDLLRFLSNYLLHHFRSRDVVGMWEKNRFILLFPGNKAVQVQFLLGKLFDDLRQDERFGKNQGVSLSAGVVNYPDNGTTLDALTSMGLELSAKKEGWGVEIANVDKDFSFLKGKDVHILLIDDDEDIVKMVGYAFEMRGFKVESFNTGEAGMQWLENNLLEHPPSFILLDCNLPDISGMVILSRIREITGADIPVIMLSTLSQEQNILEAIKKGATDYITKPFSLSILMEKTLHYLTQ